MSRLAEGLHWLVVTLWVGALWAIGLIAVPTLFHALQDRALFGALADRMFAYVAYLGITCAAYLLIFRLARFGGDALRQAFFWVVVLMLALTLIGQFGVHPLLAALKEQALPRQVMESVLRDRFSAWHGVAGALYLIQAALGGALVWLQQSAPR